MVLNTEGVGRFINVKFCREAGVTLEERTVLTSYSKKVIKITSISY